MKPALEPCRDCGLTGFSDKVKRGVWAMEPREKLCPSCGGRGWVKMKPEPGTEVANAVAEALSNALENGYDFKGWTDDQIADDMMRYSALIEDLPRDQVVAAIHGLRS
jgi:hypothetical protein